MDVGEWTGREALTRPGLPNHANHGMGSAFDSAVMEISATCCCREGGPALPVLKADPSHYEDLAISIDIDFPYVQVPYLLVCFDKLIFVNFGDSVIALTQRKAHC